VLVRLLIQLMLVQIMILVKLVMFGTPRVIMFLQRLLLQLVVLAYGTDGCSAYSNAGVGTTPFAVGNNDEVAARAAPDSIDVGSTSAYENDPRKNAPSTSDSNDGNYVGSIGAPGREAACDASTGVANVYSGPALPLSSGFAY